MGMDISLYCNISIIIGDEKNDVISLFFTETSCGKNKKFPDNYKYDTKTGSSNYEKQYYLNPKFENIFEKYFVIYSKYENKYRLCSRKFMNSIFGYERDSSPYDIIDLFECDVYSKYENKICKSEIENYSFMMTFEKLYFSKDSIVKTIEFLNEMEEDMILFGFKQKPKLVFQTYIS